MTTFLAFCVVFGLVVVAHELGHFTAAKLAGIRVYEFSVGLGPRLFSFRRHGTTYGVNLLPLGGLVRLAGLDDTAVEKAKLSERYTAKSWLSRCTVLAAGPLMNFVLALFIFIMIFSVVGVPEHASTTLASITPGSPAAHAGWQRGDVIESFNGTPVTDMDAVVRAIRASHGVPLRFVLHRGGVRREQVVRGTYYKEKDITLLGIALKPLRYHRYGPVQAVVMGGTQTYQITREILIGFARLFSGRERMTDIAGPVGIYKLSGEAAAQGWLTFLTFVAMLSINLGIFNLLPIPALDGGRLFFLILEKILPRKISVEKEQIIHYLGFAFLLLLALVITFFDIKRMIH